MLEGLEVTVLPFSQVGQAERLDPEFFSKENLAVERQLEHVSTSRLGDLSRIVASAFYPAATELYGQGDVPFARCVDCVEHPVVTTAQLRSMKCIPQAFIEESNQIQVVARGDLILTKVGTPCFASVVHDLDHVALSRTVLGLADVSGVDAYFLAAFLRGKYGFSQLMRQRELTIQYQLTLERVRNVKVFVTQPQLQSRVAALMVGYAETQLQLSNLAQEKTATINAAVGISGWQPAEASSYSASFTEVASSKRLDAEYHAPRYGELARLLEAKHATTALGDIAQVTKGRPVSYDDEASLPVVRSGDVGSIAGSGGLLRTPDETRAFRLRRGDVLVSSIGFGSIGRVQVFNLDGDYATVSEVTVIRQDVLDPYYLEAFLQSQAGQLQLHRFITGATGQLHLYPSDVAKCVVPIPSEHEQLRFNELWVLTERLESKANAKLNAAIRAVEVAVESGEAAADEFLDALEDPVA